MGVTDPDDVAARLLVIKEETGLSARDLAKLGEASHATVQAIIDGNSKKPAAGLLRRIADGTGYNVEWLVSGRSLKKGQPEIVSGYRYDSLRRVIEHPTNAGRWSAASVAAVKTLLLDSENDPGEAWCTESLIALNAVIKVSVPKLPDRGPDPLEGLDDAPVRPARKKR